MIFGFGRKRGADDVAGDSAEGADDAAEPYADGADFDPDEAYDEALQAAEEAEESEDLADDLLDDYEEEHSDWRADGPFDIDEVDLGDAERIDLGALIVTGFDGLELQLRVNKQTGKAEAVAAVWQKSALEVALFAAAAKRGHAATRRLDLTAEAESADGTVEVADGPFGTELHREVPVEGNKKKGLVHVSRIWLVDGPRWTLQGTLMGQAALGPDDDPTVAVFEGFFRNLVVRRGEKPMAPGDRIPLTIPGGTLDGKG
ncbi:MAG: DUF3710 domain-containing protein [Propionibacteriaceae bacterium]|jgi:hypothetical protein|nr:DUF3710 domain-containing protein [Propionibacteriaceae bacterium]